MLTTIRYVQKFGVSPCAWTGGSRPAQLLEIATVERQIVREMFREQCETFEDYWGDFPNRDTLRIFWNRARHDGHATMRQTTVEATPCSR